MNAGHLRAKEIFSLPEGDVLMEWPCPMTPEGYQEMAEWLALIQRKIARIAVKTPLSGD